MPPTDFDGQRLPLRIKIRSLGAVLRLFKIRQRRTVVLAPARVDDTHAHSAKDFRRHTGMGFGETLRRGLGNVMIDLWVMNSIFNSAQMALLGGINKRQFFIP